MPPPVEPAQYAIAAEEGWASDILARAFSRERVAIGELIRLGAVYLNRRRLEDDRRVQARDEFLIHLEPRRFRLGPIDWRARVVDETDDYLIVDKPAGMPVHPTCDNAVDNVAAQLEREFGRPLWLVHRLDIPTRGLMLLAKTRGFCRWMGGQFESRAVGKKYRALTRAPVAVGLHVHYMKPNPRGARQLSEIAHPGWKRCALEVRRATPRQAAGQDFVELDITLLTGRPNQIRAQLAAAAAPVIGDELYGSSVAAPDFLGAGEVIALQAYQLEFMTPEGNHQEYNLSAAW